MQPLTSSILLACAGYVVLFVQGAVAQEVTSPEPNLSQITSSQTAGNASCRDYSALATIDGRQQKISGRACRQSDGSWRIGEGTPVNATQYVMTYQPPPGYVAYDGPLLWDFPVGFSIGVPFFIDLNHGFHRFHDFGHFTHVHEFGHEGHFGGRGGFGHR